MNSALMITLSQLTTQAPMFLVYLVGIVLAMTHWRRAPKAAMLAMSGLVLLLLVSLGATVVQAYLINARGAGPATAIAQQMMILGIASSLLRAVGMALVVAAVFANRRTSAAGFEVEPSVRPPMAELAPGSMPQSSIS